MGSLASCDRQDTTKQANTTKDVLYTNCTCRVSELRDEFIAAY